jgi:hypothetical protein
MNIEIKNGVVIKDGDEIGKLDGDTCYLLEKIGPTIKGAIKKESGLERVYFVVGGHAEPKETEAEIIIEKIDEVKEALDAHSPSLADMSDDDLAAEMKRRGLIVESQYDGHDKLANPPAVVQPPVIERDLSAVERLHKLAGEGKIAQPPEKHPAMGDKDPAYVAWFKQHATPAEIATRYPENRRVPVTVREFVQAEERLKGRLPGEKKDTNKENDFTDKEDA